MKKKNLKTVNRSPELKRGRPVLVQRLVSQHIARWKRYALKDLAKSKRLRRQGWVGLADRLFVKSQTMAMLYDEVNALLANAEVSHSRPTETQ